MYMGLMMIFFLQLASTVLIGPWPSLMDFPICRVNDDRQNKIHTAEPLVPVPSPFEVETANEKLKRYKPPGCDQIPAKLITA